MEELRVEDPVRRGSEHVREVEKQVDLMHRFLDKHQYDINGEIDEKNGWSKRATVTLVETGS